MDVQQTRGFAPNQTSIGIFMRAHAPERADLAQAEPRMEAEVFSATIDKRLDEFLGKTGWQSMDPPSIVAEFVRFAKSRMEPSLDDLASEARARKARKDAVLSPKDRMRADRER